VVVTCVVAGGVEVAGGVAINEKVVLALKR